MMERDPLAQEHLLTRPPDKGGKEEVGWEVWESHPPYSCPGLNMTMDKQESLSRESCWHLVFIPFWGKKKKIHIPVKNVLPSTRNCQKPNCRQNPSDKNPLTALIQFLKEISGWKVTEKPTYFTLKPGVSKLSVLRGSPTSCPFPPGRLINESTNSYRTRLPWSLQVTSDVPLQFNSRRKKNRFFWLFLKFPFIKPGPTWKDCGSLLPLFLFPRTLLIHKEKENAMELRE